MVTVAKYGLSYILSVREHLGGSAFRSGDLLMLNIFPHHSVTQITTLLRPGFSGSFADLLGFYLMTRECYRQEGDSHPSPRPPH